ncbi:sulfatase [candidate division KSB1 bacterium]
MDSNRREFLKTFGFGTAAVSLMPFLHSCSRSKKPPNILFIMADDHTSQAFGCYGSRLAGYAPTENIDRIAREGALLRNCFCTNSICVPSRASILTGQYSHINGARTLNGRLHPDSDNVAKYLQTVGYKTAVVGKWHLKDQPAGFDYYNVLRDQGRYQNPILFESDMDWEKGGQTYQGHSTDIITDEALQWLDKHKDKSNPFCLMVHYKAVHEPFFSHDRYRSLFKDQNLPEPEDLFWPESPKGKVFDGWPLEILGERFQNNNERYPPPILESNSTDTEDFRRDTYQKFIKDYLRAVAGIDYNVGRMLNYLDETGQKEDTVIIYTSDQGYFLGEHNLFDKRFMLEESLRMPFVIRYPREIKPDTEVNDIILNIDFAELFLDYAGVDIPENMQGHSFRQNLRSNTQKNWRDSMYYRYWTNNPARPAHYGIRTHKYKLIYYYGLVEFGRKPEECWELYDLQKDPNEHSNVYYLDENKEIITMLKDRLEHLRIEYKDVN